MSHVNITTSVFFAGLTGAAITDTVAIGRILIPAMKKEGYDPAYSAAVTACSSIIGPIIPPSVVMVVYASILRNVSVLDLFAGGLVPGLLMAGLLLATSAYLAYVRGYPKHPGAPLRGAIMAFFASVPALLVPLIILGGILGGLTTITEASAFAAVYALLIGLFGYRRTLNLAKIRTALFVTDSLGAFQRGRSILPARDLDRARLVLMTASPVISGPFARALLAREAASFISNVSTDPTVQILLVGKRQTYF